MASEMIDAFDRELTARAGRARLSFGFAACLNAIGTGLVERQRQRRIRKGPVFSALDFTLAWRMLLRYPGLSLVSVLGMSVGITIAAGAFTIVSMMMGTTLPLPEGDRLVSLVNWDASTNDRELRLLYDLEAWRDAKSVEDFSVSRNVQRNLIVGDRAPEVVMVAEISASAFRAARVGAYRGRTLLPEDERAGAPDAIVIGHDEWVRRFGADPGHRRPIGGAWSHGLHDRRRDAGRVRVPDVPQLLDPVASRCRRLCAAQRSQHQRVWAARAWGHARERAGGAYGDQPCVWRPRRRRPTNTCARW